MPFYKFGELIFLEKIDEDHWISFIRSRFESTGKKINTEEVALVTRLTACHSQYVQQLAHQAWLRTKTRCWEETILEAFEQIVLQLSLLFQMRTDDLTTTQINFLKALIHGEKQLSSMEVLQEYRLGTSANVVRIKESLADKEIIDIYAGRIEFIDPAYRYGLMKYYFNTPNPLSLL